MITSMSQSELYKTLVGHYKTTHYTYFPNTNESKSAEKVETSKSIEIPENAIKVKDMPVYMDISSDLNRDRFEFSEKISYNTYALGTIPVDGEVKDIEELPFEASQAIDFMSNGIRADLEKSGYANGVVTKERIAEYYGAMAKRLDAAYAEGKFTKDEFDELNEMIEKQVEKEATVVETRTASFALGKKYYSLSPEAVSEIVQREKLLTPEERLAAREQEIRDYAERYCKIDRVALMKLFNSIRLGK
ncbi:MAG: hypothetical protein NC120_02160 [Ruminococcus sp.]|nr:hypothetical protein [Ruminococcus sp.]